VDFESIQKIDTNLVDSKTKIIVMVGLDQDSKAFEFAKNLFNSIASIELIKVNGRGPNALDMFIAFYIGRYFDNIKESQITIISKDSDYDQLIKHLDGYGISIKRINLIEEIDKPIVETAEPQKTEKVKTPKKKVKTNNTPKITDNTPKTEETQKIIEYLQKQTKTDKKSRPKKLATLENYLFTHFARKIPADEIKNAIDFMKNNGNIVVADNKIDYKKI
jgi:hypothetical protein